MNLNLDKIFNRLIWLISLGVLANLAYSYYTTDKESLGQLVNFSWGYFLLAMICSLVPWAFHSFRIMIWVHFLEYKISFKEALRIVVATDLGSAITPSWIGGGPIKVGMLVQKGLNVGSSTLILLLGSFEDILFYIIFVPLSIYLTDAWNNPVVMELGQKFQNNWKLVLAIVIGLLFVLWLVKIYNERKDKAKNEDLLEEKPSRFQSFKKKFNQAKNDFFTVIGLIVKRGRKQFLLSFSILALQWSTRFMIPVCLVLALGLDVDVWLVFLFQWMIYVVIVFIPTPGAAGGAEATFLLIFDRIIPASAISILMTGWRFLTYYLVMILAVIILQVVKSEQSIVDSGQ